MPLLIPALVGDSGRGGMLCHRAACRGRRARCLEAPSLPNLLASVLQPGGSECHFASRDGVTSNRTLRHVILAFRSLKSSGQLSPGSFFRFHVLVFSKLLAFTYF